MEIDAHPLAEQFDCPTWKEPGRCICGGPLPPMCEWTNPGMDWSSVECPECRRAYVDEEEFIAIYDDGLDPDSPNEDDDATRHPGHWWHDPNGDGHNCTFCPSSSIWKCSPSDHLIPTKAEEEFVRLVVEKVGRYDHDMTPETVVGFAYRIADLMIHSEEGLPLTSDNAVVVAAIMVATDRSGRVSPNA